MINFYCGMVLNATLLIQDPLSYRGLGAFLFLYEIYSLYQIKAFT